MTEDSLRDLCLCGETTRVQFKEVFTSQKEIAKEMIAFANSKGGSILFGVEDRTGRLIGLSYDQIQQTSRELGNAAQEQVRPIIYIETEVVRSEGRHFLVCHIAEGRNKPYKNLQGEIWVKQGADKRRITENAEILALFQDSGSYYPEEDAERGSSMDDFKVTIWRTAQKERITTQKKVLLDSNTTQKGEITTQKDSLKDSGTTQKEIDTTQKRILDYFQSHPKATRIEVADALGDITEDGVKFIIGKLQQKGLLKRVGGRKYGEWQVLI